MSDRTAQARAEAGRRYPSGADTAQTRRGAFRAGVLWADANPQPTTITRAEFEDAYEARFFQDVSHARKVLAFIRELGIEVEDDDE